ncbi:PTS glucitol/sorbitol transporter subunit IIA, partial [Enterobacter hormaechei]
CHGELNGELKAGSQLQLGEARYAVTAVGAVPHQKHPHLGDINQTLERHPHPDYKRTLNLLGPVQHPVNPRSTTLL